MNSRTSGIAALLLVAFLLLAGLSPESGDKSYESTLSSALAFEKEGNIDKAIEQYLNASRINPKKAEPLTKASILYLLLNQKDKAVFYAEKAVKVEPQHVGAWLNMSVMDLAHGRFSEAVNSTGRGLALSPGNIQLLNNQATAFFYLGIYTKAESLLMKIISKEPDNSSANYNLACVYSNTGKWDEAINSLEKAFRVKPSLKKKAPMDPDLKRLWDNKRFMELIAQ